MPEPSAFDGVQMIGDGFVLRRWRADDLDDLVQHADDAEVERGLSHRFPHPYTRADGEAFLAGHVVDFADPVFAIEISGHACGSVAVRRDPARLVPVGPDPVGQSAARPDLAGHGAGAELGYWLARGLWGRGVMTRVVALYVPWVMHALDLPRLHATVLDFNIASARVLLRNGFVEEPTRRAALLKRGTRHDVRIFARTRRSPEHRA